jgi:hypothetical protein
MSNDAILAILHRVEKEAQTEHVPKETPRPW